MVTYRQIASFFFYKKNMSRRSYIQDISYYIMNMPFVSQGQGRFEYTSVNVTFYVDVILQ